MSNNKYNLFGTELNLDNKMLERYSELICAPVGSKHFDESIGWLAEMMLKTESFEKAVSLYGEKVVSKKIMNAIEDELDTFHVEYE